MTAAWLPIALVGYLSGIALATIGTLRQSTTVRRAAILIFAATWIVHLAAIIHTALATGRFPLTNMAEYLLVLGWVVMSLYLILQLNLRVPVAGLVMPPIAGLAALGAWLLQTNSDVAPAVDPSALFLFHTTVSTAGIATLCLAFAMSVLYLVQDRALKARKGLKLLERLPALEKCDRIAFRAMVAGFILLTIGIVTGVGVNRSLYERLWTWEWKQILPVLAWIVFAAVILLRQMLGYRGRKSAYLAIAGFALGLLTVIGMRL
jgi:ABC-type uncharacterized transport system permease subunit